MRTTLTLLVASTALAAAIGLPAWSAAHAPADGSPRPFAATFDDAARPLPLILAGGEDDDDDDDDRGDRGTSGRGHDDEDDCDDDDDDDCRGGARDPAPAGTVAPPQNGLFGSGAPPRVQVN